MPRSRFVVALCVAFGCSKSPSDKVPSTDDQKTLYSIGATLGQKTEALSLTADEAEWLALGVADAAAKKKPRIEPQDMTKIAEFARARRAAKAAGSQQTTSAFLQQQGAMPGAMKLPSGVIVFQLAPGEGTPPLATDKVRVNYRGTLTDGTEFDSSYSRGVPAEFQLGGVIRCWSEGLRQIKPKGKARLVCPPETAYGDQGAGPKIPPGAALVFEVELLEVLNK